MDFHDAWFEKRLLDRFLRYVRIETTSDSHNEALPSTPGQWELLKLLEKELREIGVSDVALTDNGFLIARLPQQAKAPDCPTIGFMAHVDTSSDVTAAGVNPQLHREYDGKPISIGNGFVLTPQEHPHLMKYRGDTIITSDGTTLLGADDKAGIAEIMTAVEWMINNPEHEHTGIEIIFTRDEETGRGIEGLPRKLLTSRCCYTLDGDVEGTIEEECFNAYKVDMTFTGRSAHPGTARGVLVNAISMAATAIALLPKNESPEATDGKYGYFHPHEIEGTIEKASLTIILRDFETGGMERRLKAIENIAKAIGGIYPSGQVETAVSKQYSNMREFLQEDPLVMTLLKQAVEDAGMVPATKSIRGGTDGAHLSELGIPTPNIFTGGHNYHSRLEWAALSTMIKATKVVILLSGLWARRFRD